ncbi:cytochrome-c peroxidase [Brumimicrobium oceani]|uniref:Cytochrome-c peroxidase n=1 Tax=Brumimicrobium oceani TaxID=2100725 RepID=A0A2U2XEU1_9FLAO|nr:cytochrome c peroxidase [Brumimicrobium oceani]PWH86322.1 cytochrome-c peroxidase [Brumimicrobium oceani]
MKTRYWIGLICLPFLIQCTDNSTIEKYQFVPLDTLVYNSLLVELGEMLFFDPRLSLNNSVSCASCHNPKLAFTDGEKSSLGIHGRRGKRNSPTLWNVKNQDKFMWDGGIKSLEIQALVPLQDTNEMGGEITDLFPKLSNVLLYDSLAKILFNRSFDPFVLTRALSAFQKNIFQENSPYDDWKKNGLILDSALVRGANLFDDVLNCANCHGGVGFTNNSLQNNGLYSVYEDQGRYNITGDSADIGKFKVPTLRNISITSPYMHDGSLETLQDVIKHYSKGGEVNGNKSPLIEAFTLSKKEEADLIYFLKSLKDKNLAN